MRAFVRGWKWKLGVVTLVMAVMLGFGWVRSVSKIHDAIELKCFKLRSRDGELIYQSILVEETGKRLFYEYGFKSLVDRFDGETYLIRKTELVWSFLWFAGGRESLMLYDTTAVRHFISARYGTIVIPLTVLSAYLLLSKPKSHSSVSEIES